MTVYGKIENNKFLTAPCGETEFLISEGFSPFEDDLVGLYFVGLADIQDNNLVKNQIRIDEKEKEIKKAELQNQIDEIDQKRIRAICEPSLKTEDKTWLEFYTEQIISLREQIARL